MTAPKQVAEGQIWKCVPRGAQVVILHTQDENGQSKEHVGVFDNNGRFWPAGDRNNPDGSWPSGSWMHATQTQKGNYHIHPRTGLIVTSNAFIERFDRAVLARGTASKPNRNELLLTLNRREEIQDQPRQTWYKFGGIWSVSSKREDELIAYHSQLSEYYSISPEESLDSTKSYSRSFLREALNLDHSCRNDGENDDQYQASGNVPHKQGEFVDIKFSPNSTPKPCVVLSTRHLHAANILIVLQTIRYKPHHSKRASLILLPSEYIPGYERRSIDTLLLRGITHFHTVKHHIHSYSPKIFVSEHHWARIVDSLEDLYGQKNQRSDA